MGFRGWYSVIPACGLLVIAVTCYLCIRGKNNLCLRDKTLVCCRPIPFALLLLFVFGWFALGKVQCGPIFLAGVSGVLAFLGSLSVVHGNLHSALSNRGKHAAQANDARLRSGAAPLVSRNILLLIIAAAYSYVALDILWNDAFLSVQFDFALMGIVALFVIYLFLYSLGQGTSVGVILGVLFFTVIGIAQYFVVLYKGSPILPSDIFALGTAAAVSGGYDLIITKDVLWLLVACAIVIFLMEFITPVVEFSGKRCAPAIAANVVCALVVGGSAAGFLGRVDLAETFGTDKAIWQPLVAYKTQSFMPSFLTLAQQMRLQPPAGYARDTAERLEAEYAASYEATLTEASAEVAAQFDEARPTVIAIMNESFSDLSAMDGLGVGYQGPTCLKSLGDAAFTGDLAVSVHGGGTANSEFEFLTGNSMAHLGVAFYPYSTFNLSRVESLPRQFAELGYKTTAIHPNLASNWSRDKAYAELGFDEFLDINAFEGAEWFHAGVSDAATYDKMLELLREDDSPQFIFDLTMQNHGGYTAGDVSQTLPLYDFPAADASLDAQMNEYLTCVERSDLALAAFIEELRTLDRPVVVLFFGDHQPGISSSFNDAMYPAENEITHAERIYTTTYAIWANYDIVGNDQISARDDMSVNALGAKLMEVIGAPLTDYQKATLASRAAVPAINSVGYRGSDGLWSDLAADDRLETVNDLETLQYLNLGSKV